MTTISLQEAQANFAEFVRRLAPGDEVHIMDNDRVVARLTAPETPAERKPRQPGSMRGTVLFMASDFDAPLEDFGEYME